MSGPSDVYNIAPSTERTNFRIVKKFYKSYFRFKDWDQIILGILDWTQMETRVDYRERGLGYENFGIS